MLQVSDRPPFITTENYNIKTLFGGLHFDLHLRVRLKNAVQNHCTSFIQQALYGCGKNLKEPRGEKYGSDKGFVHRSAMTLTIDKDT